MLLLHTDVEGQQTHRFRRSRIANSKVLKSLQMTSRSDTRIKLTKSTTGRLIPARLKVYEHRAEIQRNGAAGVRVEVGDDECLFLPNIVARSYANRCPCSAAFLSDGSIGASTLPK
jgi:hypothetical protein